MTKSAGSAPDTEQRGSEQDRILADILQTALTSPDLLAPDAVAVIGRRLRQAPCRTNGLELALAALAALLYGRPESVDASVVKTLGALLRTTALPRSVYARAAQTLGFLATSDVAEDAFALLLDLLQSRKTAAEAREELVPLLRHYANWRPEFLSVEPIVRLAEAPILARHRDFILDYMLEPLAFAKPELFGEAVIEHIARRFARGVRYRYVLDFLAARPATPPATKRRIDAILFGRFPLRRRASRILGHRPFELLVILNAIIGQGDDMIRLVPLLQALLDANPALRVTVVTKRVYLYDDPRVATVSIFDTAAVEKALGRRFDGVMDFFQPAVVELNYRPDLQARVKAFVRTCRPAFFVQGDLGHGHFVYQTVRLGWRNRSRRYRFDRPLLQNVYDPCFRLLSELGLPQRAAEESPRTPSLMVGVPSADAETAWQRLTGCETSPGAARANGRPVALVNPFGGAAPIKGYVMNRSHLLAAELAGLVREGYLVVLLPNGTPWGGQSVIAATLAHLNAEIRASIRIAPDPAEPEESVRLRLSERPDLPYADRVMRLFKYFATFADLVVTVEGWLSHLAYNLGRPFRVVLKAGSYSFPWLPHGRSTNQRLVPAMSKASSIPASRTELLRPTDLPPLPMQPRKAMLQAALEGMGCISQATAVALLRRALASEDDSIRISAIAGLAGLVSLAGVKEHLLGALRDGEAMVRQSAADALLAGAVDCSRELGAGYVRQLQAHSAIARQDWRAVMRIGAPALPALAIAADGEPGWIARPARLALRLLLDRVAAPTWKPGG